MNQSLWYIRSATGVQGPFPPGQIAQYVELGRLTAADMISPDGVHWVSVAGSGQFDEALEIRAQAQASQPGGAATHGDWARERALARLRWADERGTAEPAPGDRPDARSGESVALLSLRHDHALTQSQTLEAVHRHPAYRYAALAVGVLAAVALALWYGQGRQPESTVVPLMAAPDCTAAPAAYVNWQGCDKRGATLRGRDLKGARLVGARLDSTDLSQTDLGYADLRRASLRGSSLRGARLVGADLTGADLTGADLTGAILDYATLSGAQVSGVRWADARLSKTVWVDGRACAPGSLGQCR